MVDAAGNMVAMTTTIEQNMGSGVVVPGRGFLLNNELTDFSFDSTTGSGAGFANKPQVSSTRVCVRERVSECVCVCVLLLARLCV